MSGLTVRLEDRIGLHERECRAWVERLRTDRRSAARVADELEWAVEAASAADQITSATDDSLSRLRELESEVARLLVERDAAERDLRREWWLNHGHGYHALYGDDGEMSCGACGLDFKRLPIAELRRLVFEGRMIRGAEAASTLATTEGEDRDE